MATGYPKHLDEDGISLTGTGEPDADNTFERLPSGTTEKTIVPEDADLLLAIIMSRQRK
jgi:hypothetical protein